MLRVLLTVAVANAQRPTSIPLVRPEDCGGKEYYDISHLECKQCPTGSDGTRNHFACECDMNHKRVRKTGLPENLQCEACPTGEFATADGWECRTCDTPNCECGPTDILYSRTQFGSLEARQQCSKCRASTKPSADNTCVACNPEVDGADCECISPNIRTGGLCFASPGSEDGIKAESTSSYVVVLENGEQVTSRYFRENLLAAEAACRINSNITACQVLGNLCVLQQYWTGGTVGSSACELYLSVNSNEGQQAVLWAPFMPWLYYERDGRITLDQLDIPTTYTLAPEDRYSSLRLHMAEYSLDGEFRGLRPIHGGVIQLCQAGHKLLDSAFVFGRRFRQSCQVSVAELLEAGSDSFFDMYLEYETEGEKKRFLFPVPVLNLDLKIDNVYVNRDVNRQRWLLTRRFFLIDRVTARTPELTVPTAVRYAKRIVLSVTLQPHGDGKIYPPLITTEYGVVSTLKGDDQSTSVELDKNVNIEFEVVYSMNTDKREKAMEAVLKFLVNLCGTLSNIFLITMLILSIWLLVFSKKQYVAFLLFPTEEQQYSFLIYTGLALAFKTIDLINLIIEQVTIKIFFVDWERPRGHVIPPHGEPAGGPAPVKNPSPVTIWRCYLVANEWNELQVQRKTSRTLQLILMVLLLKILNLEALALIEPNSTLKNTPTEYVDTKMSRFAVIGGLYLLVGFVQWLLGVLVVERVINDQFHNYADLCSIANISVFIMQYSQFGYYIHGRSVHGHADTNMREMNEMLQRERLQSLADATRATNPADGINRDGFCYIRNLQAMK